MPVKQHLLRPWLIVVLLTPVFAGLGCSAESTATLVIDNARVRELIPGQDKTAGYFEISNRSSAAIALTAAAASNIRAIEFHTTALEDDSLRMRRLASVRIDPGTTVAFQPGGNHLMLFGVKSLAEEQPIQLSFDDGSMLTVNFRRIAIGSE